MNVNGSKGGGVTIDVDKMESWLSGKGHSFCTDCFLIYGYDAGGIFFAQQKLIAKILDTPEDKLHGLKKVSYGELSSDPNILSNFFSTSSLFAMKTVLLVQDCGALNADLINIIKARTVSTSRVVIFVAGEIKKNSKIVQCFEKMNNAAVIPCYKPDLRAIKAIVIQWLKVHNISYAFELVESIASRLPANRALIERELEKLALYIAENRVAMSDIEAVFCDNALEASLDVLCHTFCLGLQERCIHELYHALRNDYNYMMILRSLQNYLARVISVNLFMADGKTLEESLSALNPPVFFKYRDLFVEVLHKTSAMRAQNFLSMLLQLEIRLKTISVLDYESMLQYSIYDIMQNS